MPADTESKIDRFALISNSKLVFRSAAKISSEQVQDQRFSDNAGAWKFQIYGCYKIFRTSSKMTTRNSYIVVFRDFYRDVFPARVTTPINFFSLSCVLISVLRTSNNITIVGHIRSKANGKF